MIIVLESYRIILTFQASLRFVLRHNKIWPLPPPRKPAYTVGMSTIVEDDAGCFCCGARNPHGLHLQFTYPEPGQARTTLVIPDYFTGWKSVTHGGFLSMLLDETMAHACIRSDAGTPGKTAVTVEMTVRFKKPVEAGKEASVSARVTEVRGRIVTAEGQVIGSDGQVGAEATAKFLVSGS